MHRGRFVREALRTLLILAAVMTRAAAAEDGPRALLPPAALAISDGNALQHLRVHGAKLEVVETQLQQGSRPVRLWVDPHGRLWSAADGRRLDCYVTRGGER